MLLVALSLAAVFAFAALAVVTTGGAAVRADQLRTMVVVNAKIGDLVSALQAERTAAVESITGSADDKHASTIFRDRVKRTENAVEAYQRAKADATGLPDGLIDILDEADTNLDRLESTRDKVTSATQTSAAVAFGYRIPIADLLDYRDSVPQAGGASTEVGDMIRASNQLLQSGEYESLADVAVLRAIDNGPLSELHYAQIVEAGSAADELRSSFTDLADQKWRGWLESSRDGDDMIKAQALEYQAAGTSPGEEIDIDRSKWVERADYLADERVLIQDRIDDDVYNAVSDLRTDQLWWTGGQVLAVAITVALLVMIAVRLAGPVVRGLRRLSGAARYVAGEGLPKAVARLDDHSELGDRTPEQFAKDIDPPIEVRGRDELADVGRAFNEVHEEAVRVAADQALLRMHIAAMFVRLARRGHSLAGQLTSVLDDAERTEDDPSRLERLFALDHLVTLFGRSNDSLLVLGGAASAKVRRSSESVGNVLTAAQGQIEQYTRVDINSTETEIDITADAVDDVVKLLAELLDNATQYSQGQVRLSGWMLTDRLVLQVIDTGIGIKPETLERLNTRLAAKTPLDLEAVQAMGLTVVGHLAARYGLRVALRANPEGGTIAEVSIPPNLLTRPTGGTEQPAIEPAVKQPALFDKSRKAENRRRNAEAWRQRAGTAPPPSTGQAPPAANRARADSLGAQLLPVIHFDSPAGAARQRAIESRPNGQSNQADPAPNRPKLFQPGLRRQDRTPLPAAWAQAQAAADTAAATGDRGDDGLPKREPMAQLVPGGMEPPATEDPAEAIRNPESVSATYVAFARGRAGGRIAEAATESVRDAR